MNVVLIETSGNQRYIFATNKLRENVGASDLTYRVGTDIVREVIKDNSNVEVIIATSGKALLLVNNGDRKFAEKIVRDVTTTAAVKMPGLTVHGAICEVQDNLSDIHDAVGKVHRRLEAIRYQMPSNEQRFLRLPFVAPCATSGLPACEVRKYEEDSEAKKVSLLSLIKQKNRNQGYRRIRGLLTGFNLVRPEQMEECNWVAVVHADGNGLGQLFLEFNQYAGFDGNNIWSARQYIDDYRNFSVALDDCTVAAAKCALSNMKTDRDRRLKDKLDQLIQGFNRARKNARKCKQGGKNAEAKRFDDQARGLLRRTKQLKRLPVVPLVLGGDDLTVLCDGEYALRFTHDFLTEFEKQTKQSGIIKQIASKAFGVERLGICAGVAIIKPHYPFHQAYELAEQLLKSAKQVKTKVKHKIQRDGKEIEEQLPCSAMDFHILYDSSGVELNAIREKLKVVDGKTYLYAKPYIVTPKINLANAVNKDWLTTRTWDNLATRVCAMSAKDYDGKRQLPNSQMHHIRESLHRGRGEADSEVNLFSHRYAQKGFNELLCKKTVQNEKGEKNDQPSLFFEEGDGNSTHFMDALDVVEFWKGFDCEKGKQQAIETSQPMSAEGGKQ